MGAGDAIDLRDIAGTTSMTYTAPEGGLGALSVTDGVHSDPTKLALTTDAAGHALIAYDLHV